MGAQDGRKAIEVRASSCKRGGASDSPMRDGRSSLPVAFTQWQSPKLTLDAGIVRDFIPSERRLVSMEWKTASWWALWSVCDAPGGSGWLPRGRMPIPGLLASAIDAADRARPLVQIAAMRLKSMPVWPKAPWCQASARLTASRASTEPRQSFCLRNVFSDHRQLSWRTTDSLGSAAGEHAITQAFRSSMPRAPREMTEIVA